MAAGIPNTALQNLLNVFAANAGGTSSPLYTTVYTAITTSPSLLSALNAQAGTTLTAINYSTGNGIYFSPNGSNSGTITIGKGYLTSLTSSNAQSDVNVDTMTFVLGHEDQHLVDSPQLQTDQNNLNAAAQSSINTFNSSSNDGQAQNLDSYVQNTINLRLQDEGAANINGWNAVVSTAVAANGGASLSQGQLV